MAFAIVIDPRAIDDAQKTSLVEAQAKFQLKENELEKRELALEKTKADEIISLQKLFLTTTTIALFVLGILLFLIYRQRRKVDRLNNSLDSQNNELKSLLTEKDHFMGLLTHDLRSPISSIAGNVDIVLETDLSQEATVSTQVQCA